jgi:hypothetical protein
MTNLRRSFLAAIIWWPWLVEAQWVVDNRCRRRLLMLEDAGLPTTIIVPKDSNNTTMADENEDHWYASLRGRSLAKRRRVPANFEAGRNLMEEDPTSFMMLLHWESGNCWQGMKEDFETFSTL